MGSTVCKRSACRAGWRFAVFGRAIALVASFAAGCATSTRFVDAQPFDAADEQPATISDSGSAEADADATDIACRLEFEPRSGVGDSQWQPIARCGRLESCACRPCRLAHLVDNEWGVLDTGEIVLLSVPDLWGAVSVDPAVPSALAHADTRGAWVLPCERVRLPLLARMTFITQSGRIYSERVLTGRTDLLLPFVPNTLGRVATGSVNTAFGSIVTVIDVDARVQAWRVDRLATMPSQPALAEAPTPPPQLGSATAVWSVAMDRPLAVPTQPSWACARTDADARLVCWGGGWQVGPLEERQGHPIDDTEDAVDMQWNCILRRRGDVLCVSPSAVGRSYRPAFGDVVALRSDARGCVCANRRDGTVWCWGLFDGSCEYPRDVGEGTLDSPPAWSDPVRVPLFERIALDAQIGDAMAMRTGDVLSRVEDSFDNGFEILPVGDAVEARGSYHSARRCARRRSGGAVCWGDVREPTPDRVRWDPRPRAVPHVM